MQNVEITVDFSKTTGKSIKPLHGTNNSRVALTKPLEEFHAAGIPYVRLHDMGGAYGGNVYVDIPNLFPDFSADENDPANYCFEFTDAYFKQLIASGCKIQYRLGVTIENNYALRVYRIMPPADFAKWARICEHIIRHYNEGWANGFHYNIEYWEIWNEPENAPCWTGTKEQFFQFYKTAVLHLKKCFSKLKFGGYGSCGFYAISCADMKLPAYENFKQWAVDFLDFAQKEKLPLDFFTWHRYFDDPNVFKAEAAYIRHELDQRGFTSTESFLNEWNYISGKTALWDDLRGPEGAAAVAHTMMLLQNLPVDKAMYYDAYPMRKYCGLYYFPSEKVTPTYYSFFGFNRLYQLKRQIACDIQGDGAYALAASDGKAASMMISNSGKRSCQVKLFCKDIPAGQCNVYLTNRVGTMKNVPFCKEFVLKPSSVMLIEWNRNQLVRTQSNAEKGKFAGLDVMP